MMKMTKALAPVSLVLLLASSVGCAAETAEVRPASPPRVASAPLRALRFRLPPALDASDALSEEVMLSVETALAQAGLQLLRDPAVPIDARLELASATHSVGVAVQGVVFMAIEGNGFLVDRVASPGGLYRRDRFAPETARELVDAVLASPRLAAFAAAPTRTPCTTTSSPATLASTAERRW